MVLELVVSVRTSIQAPVVTPVTHATPVTAAQTCRSQPQPDDFAEALPRDRRAAGTYTVICEEPAMADHLRTSLITDALTIASQRIDFRRDVTIFHSDRGCQYTSQEFADFAKKLGLRRSLGRTGTCYDNACLCLAESFNGTLKNERVNRTAYPTKEHARIDITRYIELRYNEKRLHSALGYITPNEAQQNWFREHQAA